MNKSLLFLLIATPLTFAAAWFSFEPLLMLSLPQADGIVYTNLQITEPFDMQVKFALLLSAIPLLIFLLRKTFHHPGKISISFALVLVSILLAMVVRYFRLSAMNGTPEIKTAVPIFSLWNVSIVTGLAVGMFLSWVIFRKRG